MLVTEEYAHKGEGVYCDALGVCPFDYENEEEGEDDSKEKKQRPLAV
jgi:hypothetical protein